MQKSTIITNDSEREAHLYWQVAAEYRAAVEAGNTAAAADALDEIEAIALGDERRSIVRSAGAMLDRHRPAWRDAPYVGQEEDEPQVVGPSYSERDLGNGMVKMEVILPLKAKRVVFREFCAAAGYPLPAD